MVATPGISMGYWKARNRPATARSDGSIPWKFANLGGECFDQGGLGSRQATCRLHIHDNVSPRRLSRFSDDIGITVLFQFQRQRLIAGADDLALVEDMHAVRHDIIEQALIMGDDNDGTIRRL